MNKNIITLLVAAFSGCAVAAPVITEHTIETLIHNKDFTSLKTVLYDSNIDVLDRSQGYSLLDYAMNKHDKRAAIILADYNNSSIPERNIIKIRNTIKYLESEIVKNTKILTTSNDESKSKVESTISQLHAMKESLISEIKDMHIKSNQVDDSSRIAGLEKKVKFLMGNFISVNEDKIDLKNKIETTKGMVLKSKTTNC